MFNDVKNKYGNIIKIMMISPAGAEGINLANVRQVHIMEPYWNEVELNKLLVVLYVNVFIKIYH